MTSGSDLVRNREPGDDDDVDVERPLGWALAEREVDRLRALVRAMLDGHAVVVERCTCGVLVRRVLVDVGRGARVVPIDAETLASHVCPLHT